MIVEKYYKRNSHFRENVNRKKKIDANVKDLGTDFVTINLSKVMYKKKLKFIYKKKHKLLWKK